MEDLSHWDDTLEFTADEAAALIAGIDPAAPGAPLHKAAPALKRLREGHRIARALVTAAPVTPDEFRLLRKHPSWAPALMSVLFDCYPMLHKEPWPGNPDRPFQLPRRFAGPDGEIEVQRFARAEIGRWLEVEGLQSKYAFLRSAEHVVPMTPALPGSSKPTVAEVTSETAEERQARRYQRCVDAKLKMPTNDYGSMPRGVGEIAKAEGLTRQALVQDLWKYIRRTSSEKA